MVTQCPSIVLGVWAGLLKKFFGYKWVADCHNEAVQPFNFSSGFYSGMIRFIHRNADACVVTNDRLKETVEKNGGRVFVLPDKVPVLDGRKPEPAGGKVKAVFICTYAPDEPYAEVVQAAKYLGSSTEFYITGNPAKADPNVIKGLPDNIHLTGYLKDEDYLRLLAEADVLVDLTLMEDCLVCGGYEAVALGKPLVTSDTQALRSYFRRGSLYAKPDARSLAEAIGEALRRKEELSREMAAFRPELEKSWQSQKEILSRFIDGQEK